MSVKMDESGRRYVQAEVEVPGTPEEVWQAIATGHGVSSWFVPTEIDGRMGGRVVSHFGPGMDAIATVTAWDPPNRFAAESGDYAPGAPPLATEWIVEARTGDTCVVRVVHSLFASTDDWDDQLASTEEGWPTFFRILQLYVEHFRGMRSGSVSLMHMISGDLAEAWEGLVGALGLEAADAGERCATTLEGAPTLAGRVEPLAEIGHGRRVLLRLDQPAQGIALVGAYKCGGPIMASINLYFYGDGAADVAAREEARWSAWLNERFPAADAAGTGA
jgi:uncharacterized protein YndB with AHSA1/START domain